MANYLILFLILAAYPTAQYTESDSLILRDESVKVTVRAVPTADGKHILSGTLENTSHSILAFQASTILGGFYVVDSVCFVNYGISRPSLIQPTLPLSSIVELPKLSPLEAVQLPGIHLPDRSTYKSLRLSVDYLPYSKKIFKRNAAVVSVLSDKYLALQSRVEVVSTFPAQ